jgi:putative transposase
MECACYFGETMFELFDPDADVRISMGTNLPHWYQPGVSYFVTFRTEDSMPVEVSRRWHAQRADWLERHGISMGNRNWRDQLDRLDVALRREFHETFSRQYLETLDKGLGACVLRRPELSKIVADALLHFDGDRYHMGDFVVMPNHVHAIVCLLGETEIEAQCTSWKRFAAKKINQLLKARGRFWQEESFDHLIRSLEQFEAIQRYIAKNPSHLKAGEFYLYQRPVAAATAHGMCLLQ